MSATKDMDHNCIGNGCRFAGCENQGIAESGGSPDSFRSALSRIVAGWSAARISETPHAERMQAPACSTCGGAREIIDPGDGAYEGIDHVIPCPSCGTGRGGA